MNITQKKKCLQNPQLIKKIKYADSKISSAYNDMKNSTKNQKWNSIYYIAYNYPKNENIKNFIGSILNSYPYNIFENKYKEIINYNSNMTLEEFESMLEYFITYFD